MNRGNIMAGIIYWLILIMFLYSYIKSNNPLALSVAADRLVDALSIMMIFVVNWISKKPVDDFHSYGYHRAEALLNIFIIVLFIAVAVYSAYITTIMLITGKISSDGLTAILSLISIPLLLVAVMLMDRDKKSNFRVMLMHSIQDIFILISAALFSIIAYYSHLSFIEYTGSYVVLFIILYGNRKLFRRDINVLLEGSSVNIKEVEERLTEEFPEAHHLHIWDICQHERVATVHITVTPSTRIGDLEDMKNKISNRLLEYHVNHVTVQFESKDENVKKP